MPIYEFFCEDCNMIFNFFSRRIDTTTRPDCPRCRKKDLARQVSLFATVGNAAEDDDQFAGLDESKMEHALESLMKESEGINEDDPRQMATLMRKFTEKTGINLGDTMEEAISRMEKGEDPDEIEKEMGDLLGDEGDFSFDAVRKKVTGRPVPPVHDETLYELHQQVPEQETTPASADPEKNP